MQLLWHLFEAVHQLPRGPGHTAAVQTIECFERRLAVLETYHPPDADVVRGL